MTKRLVCIILLFIFIIHVNPINGVAVFSDIDGNPNKAAIERWSELGIITGSGGSFHADDPITRGEMAVIIDRIMRYSAKADNTFSDLGRAFYTDSILKANAADVIKGDKGRIRPNDFITREEAIVILGRLLGIGENQTEVLDFMDCAEISTWAIGYVKAMYAFGYIQNPTNGLFKAKDCITRGEIVYILDRTIKEIFNEEKEYSKNATGTVVVNRKGVVLKDMTINGDLILAEGVENGAVTFINVNVTGKLIIRGGYYYHFFGACEITDVIIDKNDFIYPGNKISYFQAPLSYIGRVVVKKCDHKIIFTGEYKSITLIADGILADINNTKIGELIIKGKKSTVTLGSNSSISKVVLTKEAKASTLMVSYPSAMIEIAAPDTNLVINNDVVDLYINSEAISTNVQVSDEASVNSIFICAKSTIENNGAISKVIIKADEVMIHGDNTPLSVAVDPRVTKMPTDSAGKALAYIVYQGEQNADLISNIPEEDPILPDKSVTTSWYIPDNDTSKPLYLQIYGLDEEKYRRKEYVLKYLFRNSNGNLIPFTTSIWPEREASFKVNICSVLISNSFLLFALTPQTKITICEGTPSNVSEELSNPSYLYVEKVTPSLTIDKVVKTDFNLDQYQFIMTLKDGTAFPYGSYNIMFEYTGPTNRQSGFTVSPSFNELRTEAFWVADKNLVYDPVNFSLINCFDARVISNRSASIKVLRSNTIQLSE